MIPDTLRLRLPLTYAAIALLAVLALGAVLLTGLRNIYHREELNYLIGNAAVIAESIAAPMREAPLPAGWLQAQAEGLAFLTQTRIRVTNESAGTVLADSGDPGSTDGSTRIALDVTVGDVAQSFSQAIEQTGDQSTTSYTSSIIVEAPSSSRNIDQTVVITQATDGPPPSRLPTIGTLFGFGLDPAVAAATTRSNVTVRQPIIGPGGAILGYVELSQGPAYGRAILRGVARSWAIAGAVAVVLAALAGWFISWRITAPLAALTTATQSMARGDLAARAETVRRDEIGILTDSFNRMASQVEGTIAALRRFVADAAHELHTPLTAMRSDLELMAESATDVDQPRVARLREQTRRLEGVTAGLLELSRLAAETPAESFVPLDLDHLLRTASEPYASRAEQSDIAFVLDLPPQPVVVLGDDGQLRRAAGNLVDNAIKFTPPGGEVRVRVSTDGDWAVLTVADTGIGIPAEDLPQLFGRFHRARNAGGYPGSGLGLAIVAAIAEAHGGTVTAAAADGATFTLRLPLESVPAHSA